MHLVILKCYLSLSLYILHGNEEVHWFLNTGFLNTFRCLKKPHHIMNKFFTVISGKYPKV